MKGEEFSIRQHIKFQRKAVYLRGELRTGTDNTGLEAGAGKRSEGHVHKDDRKLVKADRTPEGESIECEDCRINGRAADSEEEGETQAGVTENKPERDHQSGGHKMEGNQGKNKFQWRQDGQEAQMNQRRKGSKNQKDPDLAAKGSLMLVHTYEIILKVECMV